MKKFLSVFLTAALAVSMLAGCGSKNETVTAKVIDIDLTNEEYAFGVDKNQPELLEKTNEFIAKIKSDGTLDEICKKYFSDGEPEAVKSATLDTSKDQLVVATNAAFEPFEYTKGEDYYGIDMEIAKLLADELGKELVIENMDFDAVCLSVSQQKCDIAMAGLTINDKPFMFVASRLLKSYPQLTPEKCVGCGKCAESCPAHVIRIENRKAKFKRKGCISCFCCQEMCPMKAISVKKAL